MVASIRFGGKWAARRKKGPLELNPSQTAGVDSYRSRGILADCDLWPVHSAIILMKAGKWRAR